ncbi:MAG: zinc dependent phospholipase C family protein [Clostridia bacterium]|nr:zinc dependent phospholipase C family protein [Clostridia bacterium]
MPDYFTHMIAASEIYRRLGTDAKNKITNNDLYLLGAQGGDVFFFYGISYKNNLGRQLHRANTEELFNNLIKGDLSYAAGWATHYAIDSCVHPFVYGYTDTHKGSFVHIKYERDLGLYVSRKTGVRRSILPRERVLACTLPVCDSIRHAAPQVSPSGTAECLKRHFAYSKHVFRSKKQEFALDGNYSQAFAAYEKGIELGVLAAENVLSGSIDGEIFGKSFLEH